MVLHLKDWISHTNQDFWYSNFFFHHKGSLRKLSVKCTVQPCIIFFFQNIVYPSVFCCCFFFILQNPVHLVSALRLGDILIIGEKRRREQRERREERERNRWMREEKLSGAVVALSEDAALRTSALFCPVLQSEEKQDRVLYCSDLETNIFTSFSHKQNYLVNQLYVCSSVGVLREIIWMLSRDVMRVISAPLWTDNQSFFKKSGHLKHHCFII